MPTARWALTILALCALAAPPAQAVPGGPLGTLELGRYVCEVPDTLDVTRGREMAGLGFSITTTSSYRSDGTLGSYLRTGDSVTFTTGPRKGERFRVISEGYLQKVDAQGTESSLRCVRTGRANGADPARGCRPAKDPADRPRATAVLSTAQSGRC